MGHGCQREDTGCSGRLPVQTPRILHVRDEEVHENSIGNLRAERSPHPRMLLRCGDVWRRRRCNDSFKLLRYGASWGDGSGNAYLGQ